MLMPHNCSGCILREFIENPLIQQKQAIKENIVAAVIGSHRAYLSHQACRGVHMVSTTMQKAGGNDKKYLTSKIGVNIKQKGA